MTREESRDERLGELLAMARTAARESLLLAQAERRHENTPRGRKSETGRALRDQRRVSEAAEQQLTRARARFLAFEADPGTPVRELVFEGRTYHWTGKVGTDRRTGDHKAEFTCREPGLEHRAWANYDGTNPEAE